MSSYVSREGSAFHRHSVDLVEVEALNPERIEMLGLALQPNLYAERIMIVYGIRWGKPRALATSGFRGRVWRSRVWAVVV
jgi:hypothetical protein